MNVQLSPYFQLWGKAYEIQLGEAAPSTIEVFQVLSKCLELPVNFFISVKTQHHITCE